MNAEQRAIRRYEAILFEGAPDEEIGAVVFTVDDLRKSFLGSRLLIGEYGRDIWTELSKPLVRLVGR